MRRYVNERGQEILTPCEIHAPGWAEQPGPPAAPAPAAPAKKPGKKKEA